MKKRNLKLLKLSKEKIAMIVGGITDPMNNPNPGNVNRSRRRGRDERSSC